MRKVLNYLLLAVLAGSFVAVSCSSNDDEVKDVEEKVEALKASLQTQISAMQSAIDSYKNVVNPKLEELAAADAALLASLTTSYETLEESLGEKADEEAFQNAVAEFQSAIATLVSNQEEVDGQQSSDISALNLLVETLSARIESYKTDTATELDTRIAAVETTINATIATLEARVKANEDAIKKLNEETIPALEARIKACEDADAESVSKENIDAINDVLEVLKSSKLDKATYDTFLASFNDWKGAVDTQLAAIDDDIASLQEVLEVLEKELAILKTEQNPGYITLQAYVEGIRDALQAQIDLLINSSDVSIEDAVKVLNEKIQEKLSALDAEIAILKSRVQSLVFVPQYKDLKFGIPFSKLTDGTHSTAIAYNDPEEHFEVVYKVTPDTLAASLAEQAEVIFTFAIESGLQTRRPALAEPKLTIVGAEGDNETGKITFKLGHENFYARIEGDSPVIDTYAVSLVVEDEAKGIHVASEYTQTVNVPSPVVTVDMTNLYVADTTSAGGVKVAYTKTSNEYTNEMQYIDSTLRTPYKDCFLAATIDTDATPTPRSFDALKELGYNMPKTSVSITSTDNCSYLKHAALDTVKYATVNIDSTATLKTIKEHLIGTADTHTKTLSYKFGNGIGGALEMGATITLGKADSLAFNLYHEMKWTYADDKEADHKNFNNTATNYSHAKLVTVPKLIVGEKEVMLDGSDAAYGIVASDFAEKVFTKAADATVPEALKEYSYDVVAVSDADTTVTLGKAVISSWGAVNPESKVCEAEYDVPGSYVLPFAKETGATVKVKAIDRNRAAIDLELDQFKVTILGGSSKSDGGEYVSGEKERYLIQSANLAAAVYNKYVEQGIFSADKYTQKNAFGVTSDSEFNEANVVWTNTTDEVAARFQHEVVTSNTVGGILRLQSNDVEEESNRLSSAALMKLAQNYGENGAYLKKADTTKVVNYSFTSYIGQAVNLKWSVVANPADTYMLSTYGALKNASGDTYFNISANDVWGNPAHITKANTELDLLWNGNVQVVTGTGGNGGINPGSFAAKGLVPRFTLAASDGVSIAKKNDGDGFASNLKYYGHADSVSLKAALYVKSGSTEFFVPGSDSLFVNYSTAKIDSFFVYKFNPIAPVASQDTLGNTVIDAGSAGVLPLNLKDANGNKIYKNGYAQNNIAPYYETVANIFGDIAFELVSVNGSEDTAGWLLASDSNSVKLTVPAGTADGIYTVVVKAVSSWEDYSYTFSVRCGRVQGGIGGNNPDYGAGGNETWN